MRYGYQDSAPFAEITAAHRYSERSIEELNIGKTGKTPWAGARQTLGRLPIHAAVCCRCDPCPLAGCRANCICGVAIEESQLVN